MNARVIVTVYRKELRDTLRDRRALVAMFVLPTVVLPLLVLGFGVAASRVVDKAKAEVAAVMLLDSGNAPALRAALSSEAGLDVVPATDDFRDQIADRRLRAAVEVPPDFEEALARGDPRAVRLHYHEGDLRSGFAVAELERSLRSYRDGVVAARLGAQGLSPSFVTPFSVSRQNVAPPERVAGSVVGGFIPYVVILLCFTGAMYPAIDLTAGEKERGTMETLLCTPAARGDLVLGKFLVVLTGSLATVLFAGLSAVLTLPLGARLVTGGPAGPGGGALAVDLPGLFASLGLIVPIAVLFSAVLFALALTARTQKEAQSTISPLIVVVMLPALAALLPGFELTPALAFVPVLNVALASKALVSGVFDWPALAVVLFSTSFWAAAALFAAVRMFRRESVLFNV